MVAALKQQMMSLSWRQTKGREVLHWKASLACLAAVAIAAIGGFCGGFGLDSLDLFGLYW
jgi:hypothetical protein